LQVDIVESFTFFEVRIFFDFFLPFLARLGWSGAWALRMDDEGASGGCAVRCG